MASEDACKSVIMKHKAKGSSSSNSPTKGKGAAATRGKGKVAKAASGTSSGGGGTIDLRDLPLNLPDFHYSDTASSVPRYHSVLQVRQKKGMLLRRTSLITLVFFFPSAPSP